MKSTTRLLDNRLLDINTKLTTQNRVNLFLFICFLVVLTAGFFSVTHIILPLEQKKIASELRAQVTDLTKSIRLLVSTSESNGDKKLSTLITNKLQQIKGIESALLYDKAGRVVYSYQEESSLPQFQLATNETILGNLINLQLPIQLNDQVIGRFALYINNELLTNEYITYFKLLSFSIPLILLFSYAFVTQYKKQFITPISKITQQLCRLSNCKQLHYQFQPSHTPEIRQLHQAIKQLLTRIQKERDRLIKSREDAEDLAKTKAEFLANMSHEIRAPMNVILGMLSLLRDTKLDRQQQEYAKNTFLSGKALLTIVDDILDFSKVEAGKLSIEYVNYNLENLINEVITLFIVKANEKNLRLISKISSHLPRYICSDPTRLRQILNNLISNAIKFTERGEIVLTAKIESKSHDRITIKFKVSDTGIGIPGHCHSCIFESFDQGNASTARNFGGTGLGLAISKRLINAMHGEINVSSIPDQGSCFTFTIEVKKSIKNSVLPLKTLTTPNINTILYSDMSQTINRIELLLSELNIKFTRCHDEESAIRLIQHQADTNPINLLIADCLSCELNVLDLATRIQMSAPDQALKFIMTCAIGKVGDGKKTHQHGYHAYLTLPISAQHLQQTIFQVLNIRDTVQHPELITRHSIRESQPSSQATPLITNTAANSQETIDSAKNKKHLTK